VVLNDGCGKLTTRHFGVTLALGDGESERRPPLDQRRHFGQEASLEGVDGDRLGAVDVLPRKLTQELRDVRMGVDGGAPRDLAATVQALGVGEADLE
jgi:hypothetical protein